MSLPGGEPADSATTVARRRRRWGRWAAWAATAGTLAALLVAVAVLRAGVDVGRMWRSAPQTSPTRPAASASASPTGPAVKEAVESLLRTATVGVVKRRPETYLSVFDPSDAALLARHRQVFANLMKLPLDGLSLARNWECDPVPASTSRGLAAQAVVVRTLLSYRFKGAWDNLPVLEQLPLTMAPTPHGWKIVSDADDPAVNDVASWRSQPWWAAPIEVVAGTRALVIADAGKPVVLRRLVKQLDALLPRVRARWPEESWNGRVVAYAATHPTFVQAWFTDPQAARTGRGVVAEVVRVGHAPRVIVSPFALGGSGPQTTALLLHELTHVATHGLGDHVPRWLAEGAAEFTAYRTGGATVDDRASWNRYPRAQALASALAGRPLELIADPDAFYRGSPQQLEVAYAQGWLACLYIAHRYGDTTLRRLYQTVGAYAETLPQAQAQDDALRQILRQDQAHFTRAVQAYGRALSGHRST